MLRAVTRSRAHVPAISASVSRLTTTVTVRTPLTVIRESIAQQNIGELNRPRFGIISPISNTTMPCSRSSPRRSRGYSVTAVLSELLSPVSAYQSNEQGLQQRSFTSTPTSPNVSTTSQNDGLLKDQVPPLSSDSATSLSSPSSPPPPDSLLTRILKRFKLHSPKQIVINDPVGSRFNRYIIVPAAVFTQLSLGSIFAWSMFNQPLTHLLVGCLDSSLID